MQQVVDFCENEENFSEISERLGRQARPRNEPGTSRRPIFERSHWWSQERTARHPCLTRYSNPGSLVQQPASKATALLGRRDLLNT